MSKRRDVRSGRIGRMAMLGGMAARLAGDMAFAAGRLATTASAQKAEAKLHARAAKTLVRSFGEMKGLPMKLGQLLSYIDDHIPAEHRPLYQDALRQLQAKARPLDWEPMENVIREDLGERADALIAGIDREPIAAASIGQVYRAELTSGQLVAVKVQYPGIAKAIANDLKNADALISAMSVVLPKTDVEQTLSDISGRLLEECDYAHELDNQREMRDFWHGDEEVLIPAVYEELSGPRVLVTELVAGSDFQHMMDRTPQEERDQFGRIMARFTFRSLYVSCTFNADPHPGNYIYMDGGRVAFIDFGCVQRFSREDIAQIVRVRKLVLDGVRGPHLWSEITDAYGLPEALDDELWEGFLEDYVCLSFEPLLADQPFRYSRHYTETMMKIGVDAKMMLMRKTLALGAREAKMPGLVFLNRINFGLASILARMNASFDCHELIAPIDVEGGWAP